MLQLVVFELALLIGVAASFHKDNIGLQVFGWVATIVFIAWGIAIGASTPQVINRF